MYNKNGKYSYIHINLNKAFILSLICFLFLNMKHPIGNRQETPNTPKNTKPA